MVTVVQIVDRMRDSFDCSFLLLFFLLFLCVL